ncbi:MAG: T9SS type A sorting domain-containing protein [Saprospiraceae bacterium]|nr:T9SS type A sorting domain-containing protein [Saprospiraceae bacterium]
MKANLPLLSGNLRKYKWILVSFIIGLINTYFCYSQDCTSDTIPPTPVLYTELLLDMDFDKGFGVLRPQDFDKGSYDNCDSSVQIYFYSKNYEYQEIHLAKNALGYPQSVWLELVDQTGNSSKAMARYMIRHGACDSLVSKPQFSCKTDHIIPIFNQVQLTPETLINFGSYDFCSFVKFSFDEQGSIDKITRKNSDIGKTEMFTIYGMNQSGQTSFCNINIQFVEHKSGCENDRIAPVIKCRDTFLVNDTHRDVHAKELILSAVDDCEISHLQYYYSGQFSNLFEIVTRSKSANVLVQAYDLRGNSSYCKVILKADQSLSICTEDSIKPYGRCVKLKKLFIDKEDYQISSTALLEAFGDNCPGPLDLSFSTNPVDSIYTLKNVDYGNHVQLEVLVTDQQKNTSSCKSIILPVDMRPCQNDTTPPVIKCKEHTVIETNGDCGNETVHLASFLKNYGDNCSNTRLSFVDSEYWGCYGDWIEIFMLEMHLPGMWIYAKDEKGNNDSCFASFEFRPWTNTSIPINITDATDNGRLYESKLSMGAISNENRYLRIEPFRINDRLISISHYQDEKIKTLDLTYNKLGFERNNVSSEDIQLLGNLIVDTVLKHSLSNLYYMDIDQNDTLDIRDALLIKKYIFGDTSHNMVFSSIEPVFVEENERVIGKKIEYKNFTEKDPVRLFYNQHGNYYDSYSGQFTPFPPKFLKATGPPVTWYYKDKRLTRGQEIWVDINLYTKNQVFMTQGSFSFKKDFAIIDSVYTKSFPLIYQMRNNGIAYCFVLNSQPNFHKNRANLRLKLKILNDAFLSEIIEYNPLISSFAVGYNGATYPIVIRKTGILLTEYEEHETPDFNHEVYVIKESSTSGRAVVKINLNSNQTINTQIVDLYGRLIAQSSQLLDRGEYKQEYPLIPGMYMVQIYNNNGSVRSIPIYFH